MSSYFDFTVERKVKDKWTCILANTYEDELDIINPYILKSVFWDAEEYEFPDVKTISEKTWEKFTYAKEFYYSKKKVNYNWEITSEREYKGLPQLQKLSNNAKFKFDYTGIKLTEDNVKQLVSGLVFYEKVKIENLADIKTHYDKLGEVIEYREGEYCIVSRTPYYLWTRLAGMKNQEVKIDTIVTFCLVSKATSKRIRMYDFYDIKVSDYKNLVAIKKELEQELAQCKKTMTVEKLVKQELSSLMEEKSFEEIKNTEFGRTFMDSYHFDPISYCNEDLKELECQLNEVKLLLQIVGENGRLIWTIV